MQPSEGYWDQLWQNGLLFDQVVMPPLVGWALCNLRECGDSFCAARHLFPALLLPGAEEQGTLAGFLSITCFLLMAEPHDLTSGVQESEAGHYAVVWTLLGPGAVWTILVPKEMTRQCCSPSHPFYLGEVMLPVPGEAQVLKGNLNPLAIAALWHSRRIHSLEQGLQWPYPVLFPAPVPSGYMLS